MKICWIGASISPLQVQIVLIAFQLENKKDFVIDINKFAFVEHRQYSFSVQ